MNNPIFNAARTFLSKKYQILNPSDLYKYLVQTPQLCHSDTLKNNDWEELLSKLVFLGQFHERRNLGPQAKQLTQNCLLQVSKNMPRTDVSTLLQIFLVMSNVLIYDEKMINHILAEFKASQDSIHVRQSQTISHCLYKLGRKNEFWQKRACEQMLENVYNIGVQDYVQYIHIASNLYQMNQFEEKSIYKLLEIMKFKFEKQQKHIFLSKFSYQFIQLIFNIYPEIIKQPVDTCVIDPHNKFKDYFNYLKRDYIICRKILDKKHSGISLDYFENDNFPNLIRLKEDTIQRKQTPFEGYIEKVLNSLSLDYKEQVRLAIYDVDFIVQNKFVLNCNGPSHFIEDLDGNVLAKSPNFLMQQRHLNELGTHKLIDLDYYVWDKYDTTNQQIEALKKHLNI